eukprot:245411_1
MGGAVGRMFDDIADDVILMARLICNEALFNMGYRRLRTWTFEGSLDGGQTWKLLSRHKNDTSLNQKGATATWKLSEGDYGNNTENLELFYSHFRIYGAMKDMDD